MLGTPEFAIRKANPSEFEETGKLLINTYSQLEGFPKPHEQPAYYQMLANVGRMTEIQAIELLVAVSDPGRIGGCVVYYPDMKYYGSGGTSTAEKNSSGFRLLAVDPELREKGIGKMLILACINKAKK